MNSNLILTTAQAQAVYGAMCALNTVGGFLRTNIECLRIEDDGNGIRIMKSLRTVEVYDDRAAFAAAYGLRATPDSAVLLKEAERAARRLDWFLDMNPDHIDSLLNVIRQDLRASIAQTSA